MAERVTVEEQRQTLVWCVKTAMVFDATARGGYHMAFDASDRKCLRDTLWPDPLMRGAVFLAHNTGPMEFYSDEYKIAIAREPLGNRQPTEANWTSVRTMVFGQLLVQVMVLRMKREEDGWLTIDGREWNEKHVDITQPRRAIVWPPLIAIHTAEEFVAFRDRWSPELVREMRAKNREPQPE